MMEEKIALIKFLILICDNTTCSSNKLRALCRKEYIYIFKKIDHLFTQRNLCDIFPLASNENEQQQQTRDKT